MLAHQVRLELHSIQVAGFEPSYQQEGTSFLEPVVHQGGSR